MSIPTFSESRSEAIRDGLVAQVEQRRHPLRFGWRNLAVFALSGALVGGAVSGAAWAAQGGPEGGGDATGSALDHDGLLVQQDAENTGVPAPDGIIPGAPIVSLLGDGPALTVTTAREVDLAPIPDGTTHVRVSVTCLTAGSLSWGFDPSGNNPSSSCGAADAGEAGRSWYDFPLGDQTTLFLTPGSGRFTVTYQYLNFVETAWGITDTGETYGVSKEDGRSPELIAVMATTPDGSTTTGYARWTELEGPQPATPEEAAAWDPEPRDVPVYAPDGVTRIGVFRVG